VSEQEHGADEPTEASPGDDRESAYELLQRGHDLLTQRHFAQAAVVLERADREEPGKASILEALGRAYYNSGQHDRSRATFEQLLEIDPSAHYAHFALGQSLKQLGRPDAARTHLRLAVALSPTSKVYAAALARLPSGSGRAGADDEEREDRSATGE
jgi:tetratricopeptide (TPR) repeat protein